MRQERKQQVIKMKITKAVIPAAGLGTRMLPISKAVPKEMLPIVDRPAISYLIDEAVASGITDILIITAGGKEAIEDYFDYSAVYEKALCAKGRTEELAAMRATAEKANVHFIRQREAKGLGHAILTAKAFVGGDDFAVLYGDDIIVSEVPVTAQLLRVYERYGRGVAGVKAVPWEQVTKYCSLKTEAVSDGVFHVTDMIEKPASRELAYSNYSILGRVVLPAKVFDILEHTAPGAGNEIQLTDAMAALSRDEGMYAVDFEGVRYDMGSKLGFLEANVREALKHEEIGAAFREFLKEVAKDL